MFQRSFIAVFANRKIISPQISDRDVQRRSIKHPTVEIPHSCFLCSLEEPSWAFHRFVATRCRTRDAGGLALCWSRHEGFKCRVRFCSNWSQRVSIHVRSQNTTTTRLINPVVHAYAKLFSNESSVLFVLLVWIRFAESFHRSVIRVSMFDVAYRLTLNLDRRLKLRLRFR